MKSFGSTYFILALSTFCLFVMLGAGGILQSKLGISPPHSVRGLAKQLPNPVIKTMLALEVPRMQEQANTADISQNRVLSFLFEFITHINLEQPWSLVSSEVPGMRSKQASYANAIVELNDEQFEQTIVDDLIPDGLASSDDHFPKDHVTVDVPLIDIVPDPTHSNDSPTPEDGLIDESQQPSNELKVFIYHSHNRESWLPELAGAKKASDAFDATTNITLLGDRLAGRLQDLGIGAMSSNKDYSTTVPDYNWNFSYAYSLKTVKEAFAVNPHLEYYFDIHRDSQKKNLTTATINGQAYAKVYFVIGRKNPNWEKNETLAEQIHDLLEEKYPGISRGILGKNANSGHAEYNQSFSANSILIEVGGVENTLEESNRTIDALGETIAEIIWGIGTNKE